MFDENMNLDIQIKNIRQIKKFLTVESTQAVVQSLVLSRLDYCNSLYHGLPKFQISKLQRIQNSSAGLITCTPYHEHIKPVLMQLHCLPVPERVQFKVFLFTFMAIQGLAPSYISELVHIQQSQNSAQSVTVRRLLQPRSATKTCGDRAFSIISPRTWNTLPAFLRSINYLTSFIKPWRHSYLLGHIATIADCVCVWTL